MVEIKISLIIFQNSRAKATTRRSFKSVDSTKLYTNKDLLKKIPAGEHFETAAISSFCTHTFPRNQIFIGIHSTKWERIVTVKIVCSLLRQNGVVIGVGRKLRQSMRIDQYHFLIVPFTDEGVIFDVTNLVPYVMKHKKNPITGEPMATNQIIRLNMSKNADDVWQCPVTCKVFNDNTHVVAIKTTGNVYCYDAVYELNIKAKNFTDLLTGEKFVKADIITLQDPQNEEHMARRDVSTFVHLHQIREENKVARQTGKIANRSYIIICILSLTISYIFCDVSFNHQIVKYAKILQWIVS